MYICMYILLFIPETLFIGCVCRKKAWEFNSFNLYREFICMRQHYVNNILVSENCVLLYFHCFCALRFVEWSSFKKFFIVNVIVII